MELFTYRIADVFERFSSGKNITESKIHESDNYPVYGGNGLRGFTDTYNFDGECILIGRQGAKCGNVRYFNGKGYMTDHAIVGVCKPDFSTKFINYALSSLNLNRLSGQAAQPGLSVGMLKKQKILLPSFTNQTKIADIIYEYNNLIENNNRRIALLEKAAQELYKEWFVRFRFPGYETAEFENGIPKDWRVLPVKETFEIFDTERIPVSSMDRDRMQKIYPYYGAAELMDYVDDYLFDGVYLLLGEDGSVMTPKGKPVLQYVWGKFWVNNHAHVLQGKMPFSTEYLHLMFGQMDITGIVTGAAQPKISQGRLLKKKTIIPNLDLVKQFDEIIQPIYKIIRNLKESNQNLTKQRDLLLPRLMSGKLEV